MMRKRKVKLPKNKRYTLLRLFRSQMRRLRSLTLAARWAKMMKPMLSMPYEPWAGELQIYPMRAIKSLHSIGTHIAHPILRDETRIAYPVVPVGFVYDAGWHEKIKTLHDDDMDSLLHYQLTTEYTLPNMLESVIKDNHDET